VFAQNSGEEKELTSRKRKGNAGTAEQTGLGGQLQMKGSAVEGGRQRAVKKASPKKLENCTNATKRGCVRERGGGHTEGKKEKRDMEVQQRKRAVVEGGLRRALQPKVRNTCMQWEKEEAARTTAREWRNKQKLETISEK